jgi:hypothetical protein
MATLAILFVTACGDGGTSSSNSDAGAGTCQATLSGAVSGTFSCLITLAYTTQNDRTTFGFSVAMPAPLQMVSGVATRSGMPSASQTWANTDATGTGTFFVQSTGIPAQSWLASSGTAMPQGSYSITFMPGSGTAGNGITTYADPSGSFSATLPPGVGTSTSGTVMMTVSF